MEIALAIVGILALTGACVMFVQARRTYAALSDYTGINILERRIKSLERDRDSSRAQEAHSGEYAWGFPIPNNVQPRVVDFSQEDIPR